MGVAILFNDPWNYGGGWEFQNGISELTVSEVKATGGMAHNLQLDPDGSFQAAVDAQGSYQGIYPTSYDKPTIVIENSYPYYIERNSAGEWVLTDDPEPLDTYTVPADISQATTFQKYYHWTIGFDVTFKTSAAKIYKPILSYWDYGYWYEDEVVDTSIKMIAKTDPWTPVGTIENWTITDGWAGIMSASVVKVSYGLVGGSASENKGHEISNLHSEGAALNMEGVASMDFDDPSALQGVPTEVKIGLSARLGAGAQYYLDALSHVSDLAVRNVFVKYTVRIDYMTTLAFSLNSGHQGDLEDPDEDNTAYEPELPSWLQKLADFMQSPFAQVITIIIILAGGVLVIFIVKR